MQTSRLLMRPLVLALALAAAAPALAQTTTPTTDTEIIAAASVPRDRLVDRYTDAAGSPDAAGALVDQLRAGGDFTYTEMVTTTVTNPDGTTTRTTAPVTRTIDNPTKAMGWGEVNISLSLANALVEKGVYTDLQSALMGTATTTTNPDGTTTTAYDGGVLALRADGMGWGKVAKELGFNLGALMSGRGERTAQADKRTAAAKGQPAKVDARTARAERPAKAERPQKMDRPVRPERAERPQRPERPARPERGGRG